MSKLSYAQLLKTFEWHQRRDQILERDEHTCQQCYDTEHLQVHHRYYVAGRKPWEYPDFALITLCNSCHEKEHEPYTFNTWELIAQDLRIDSEIAPLLVTSLTERIEKSGVDYETMICALIKSLDSDEIWSQMLTAGREMMQEKYAYYENTAPPADGQCAR